MQPSPRTISVAVSCGTVTVVEGLQLLFASVTETIYVPTGKFESIKVRFGEEKVETVCVYVFDPLTAVATCEVPPFVVVTVIVPLDVPIQLLADDVAVIVIAVNEFN